MILSTTEFIPEREIEKILGIARGSTVRSRNAARDLIAQLKNIIGGEIEEYTKLQAHARAIFGAYLKLLPIFIFLKLNNLYCFLYRLKTSLKDHLY